MGRRWQVQATYDVPAVPHVDVTARALGGRLLYALELERRLLIGVRLAAPSADEALARVDARMALASVDPGRVRRLGADVQRVRRLGRRRKEVLVSGGPRDGGGAAGVREPRRPVGDPPSGSVAREPGAA